MTRGRFGRSGELIPARGFSRAPLPAPSGSWWTSHDWLRVCSTLEHSILPGTDDEVGPQWHLSVSKAVPHLYKGMPSRANRPSDADMARVIDAFRVPGGEEDNHHPGVARHLWCPVVEQYRTTCECKLSEATVVEADGYRWTTEAGEECRGCQYGRMFPSMPCTVHGAETPALVIPAPSGVSS